MTKFCTQCGAQVAETARFCKKCGTRLLPTQPAQTGAAPVINYQPPNYQQTPDFGQGYGQPPYQAPYQSPAAHADLKPNVAGMLCYPLSFVTGILFLVLAPYNKDRFVRFHAYQSIFFFVTLFVLSIILRIIFPWRIEGFFLRALELIFVAGTGWSMYKAWHGKMFKLPLVGDQAEKQASKHPV